MGEIQFQGRVRYPNGINFPVGGTYSDESGRLQGKFAIDERKFDREMNAGLYDDFENALLEDIEQKRSFSERDATLEIDGSPSLTIRMIEIYSSNYRFWTDSPMG